MCSFLVFLRGRRRNSRTQDAHQLACGLEALRLGRTQRGEKEQLHGCCDESSASHCLEIPHDECNGGFAPTRTDYQGHAPRNHRPVWATAIDDSRTLLGEAI
jgi:hypothetical protein